MKTASRCQVADKFNDYMLLNGVSLRYCQPDASENTRVYPNTLSTRCSTMGIDSWGGKPLAL